MKSPPPSGLPPNPSVGSPSSMSVVVRRLTIFFGLVYFMQGVGQSSGLVSQPLFYYFKEGLGLGPAQTTEYLAILTIPWLIKPVYGLISDFVPLFGYRRKSYLYLANALAAAGFIWLTGLTAPGMIITAMFFTALGTAASDVLVDAVMVENGQETGQTKQFQATQWMWFNVATLFTSWFGGFLSQLLPPTSAFHIAALITVAAPLAVMLGTLFLVEETQATINLKQMKTTADGMLLALKSKSLWAVMIFLAFWSFSPSLGTPLYYHMIDRLQFSQGFIGWLGVYRAVGAVMGAWLYRKRLSTLMSTRTLVSLSIVLGAADTLATLWLVQPNLLDVSLPIGSERMALGTVSEVTAVALTLTFGIAEMIGLLTMLSLAADACPKQAEGFTFAALMSVFNFAAQISAIIGARLYVDVFDRDLTPLILISTVSTLACFLLFPLLKNMFTKSDEGPISTP